ncbi:GIY-YIG nuclease family protein [Alphaproteobacteria bacterium]|nr:GIY-YIG nuclease family protein [Alphaproteobacteria bacterium]
MPDYYAVYILANKNNTSVYVGQTNDLMRRFYEHKQGLIKGHTRRYNINKLVHYELVEDRAAAMKREAQLKGWLRIKKDNLIEATNPNWTDLGEELFSSQ